MILFALFSLFASILALFLANAVYNLDKKKPLNILFAIFAFCLSYWCFTEFMYRQADTSSTAYLWMKLGFIWPIPTVLTFHFALVFTEKIRSLKNTMLALFLYGPAVIFSLIYLTTNLVTTGVVQKFWGYTYVASDSWVCTISNAWAFLLTFSAIFLCLSYYLETKEKTKKEQAKYVTLGFLIPVFVAFLTEGLLPLFHVEIPEITTISTVLLGLFVGYAMWKYKLFSLNPATAAETIISTMSDPLILTDDKDQILKVNQAVTRFLGYSEKDLLGKSIDDIFREPSLKKRSGPMEKDAIKKHEVQFKTKSEEEKYVIFSSSEVKAKNGQPIGTVYIIHDITKLKQLENQLVTSERFAAIGELAGMIGHDLRNPLTGIKTAVYFLEKKGTAISEAKAKEMFQTIKNCINHSNKIINDLLDYSKEIHLKRQANSPRSLVNEALQRVQTPDRIKVINFTSDETQIFVDPDKILRVFINLIKNAIDVMPTEGKIVIDSKEADGNLEIRFADNGAGIPNEIMPKLFTPLFTTKAQGMGFGLAICKRIIEEHGGKITVETAIGKGSVFKVTLPIERKQENDNEKEWTNATTSSGVNADQRIIN
jgi:PAS domain S-box-containing protein